MWDISYEHLDCSEILSFSLTQSKKQADDVVPAIILESSALY